MNLLLGKWTGVEQFAVHQGRLRALIFQINVGRCALLALVWAGSLILPAAAETSFAKGLTSKEAIFEVPAKGDCNPGFVAGGDGIFRRVQYCHKMNPTEPKDFLHLGFDVPASFLVGFGEADVLERWGSAAGSQTPDGSSVVGFPALVYATLNALAAQTWERLLTCAKGDGDAARELYRTRSEACEEKSLIRSSVAELRTSLRMLTASGASVLSLDVTLIERQLAELQQKENLLWAELGRTKSIELHREHQSLLKQVIKLRDLLSMLRNSNYREVIETHLPRMPRLHPLLMQVMVEDLLSFLNPDEALSRSVQGKRWETSQERYFRQLLLWLSSVENRGCSAFGLWPSANRAAIDSFVARLTLTSGGKSEELAEELVGPRVITGGTLLVRCPMLHLGKPLTGEESFELLLAPEANEVMRLNDTYLEGRLQAWRELIAVRRGYTSDVKP